MRIKMSPLGTKGSVLLGDIGETALSHPFIHQSCQSWVMGCFRGRGPSVPWAAVCTSQTHLHGERTARVLGIGLQLSVWGKCRKDLAGTQGIFYAHYNPLVPLVPR